MRCSRVAELTEQLHSSEDKGRADREALLDRVHELTAESTAAKVENQSLKVKHASRPQKAGFQHIYWALTCRHRSQSSYPFVV